MWLLMASIAKTVKVNNKHVSNMMNGHISTGKISL